MKRLLRWVLRVIWRLRAFNPEVLAIPGPVLLVPNHVSWLDWLLLGVWLEDDWRFVTSNVTAQLTWIHRWIMVNHRTFPIDPSSPYAVKRMAEFLDSGGRLVLFAEGQISRTGSLMKLFDGTGFLLHKTQARVITAYLRGAERLPWVRHADWTQWFPRVTVHFSGLLTPPPLGRVRTSVARQRLTQWLRQQMLDQQFRVEMEQGPATVGAAIAATARRVPGRVIVEDATGQAWSYRRLLIGSAVLARSWGSVLAPETPRVGVLLPNLNVLPLVLLSLWRAGKVPALLNYTAGPGTIGRCARVAGLRQIITSQSFLQRLKLPPERLVETGVDLVYLEALAGKASPLAKLWVAGQWCLGQSRAAFRSAADATAVVLFTSGSEGEPKGVELTHANLLANLRQIQSVIDLNDRDRMCNALPLFHSFGLTVGTLMPLVRGIPVFLYPSALHYRMVPNVVYDQQATLFLATNTFLKGYARKAHPYDFHTVRYLFAGAEKLQESTAALWAQRFGLCVREGYGVTECSPVVSVNTPLQPRAGSVGQFLPGIEYRLDPVPGMAEGGRLWVRGPNVMRGYLNPAANAPFQAAGGWYDTGDLARVDEEGFLFVLGRLRRFAKISGEMVSLAAVEETLAGAFPQYGERFQVAVLSQPDPERGESLLAITNEPRLKLEEIRAVLKANGLSNLCVPRSVRAVSELPKLSTGKINYPELARLTE